MGILDAMDAKEQGAALFVEQPELLLAAVWHVAAKQFPDDRDTQREFVNAYSAARTRRDEYRKEKRDAATPPVSNASTKGDGTDPDAA